MESQMEQENKITRATEITKKVKKQLPKTSEIMKNSSQLENKKDRTVVTKSFRVKTDFAGKNSSDEKKIKSFKVKTEIAGKNSSDDTKTESFKVKTDIAGKNSSDEKKTKAFKVKTDIAGKKSSDETKTKSLYTLNKDKHDDKSNSKTSKFKDPLTKKINNLFHKIGEQSSKNSSGSKDGEIRKGNVLLKEKKLTKRYEDKSLRSKEDKRVKNAIAAIDNNRITNVTVNSPNLKRKRMVTPTKVSQDSSMLNELTKQTTEILVDNLDLADSEKIKHNRYRTRTLEPQEIKVMKESNVSNTNNTEMTKLLKNFSSDQNHPLIGKPKAFFVELNESTLNLRSGSLLKTNKPIDKSPADSEAESPDYEDDFESYESDFESFNSSLHSESSNESNHSSKKREFCSDSRKSSINDDDSFSTRKTQIHDEESNLDSGNFDLREIKSSKTCNVKMGGIKEDILEVNEIPYTFVNMKVNDSMKQISYTDEGFDENSGGFSSTSNSALIKGEDAPNPSKRLNSLYEFKAKRSALSNYYAQRALDLSNLITLDKVKFSLFEIHPVPYDVFIKTFGKSNFIQNSCQTNDDYVDEITQTDLIFTDNKWTQNPIAFSKFDICITRPEEKPKVKYQSFNFEILNEVQNRMLPNDSNVITIKNIENPLEIYYKQRLGSNISSNELKRNIELNILSRDHNFFSKFYKFMKKVGKFMIEYLEYRSTDTHENFTVKSDFKISKSFTEPLRNIPKIDYLKDRQPMLVSFSNVSVNSFLTVHGRRILQNNKFKDTEDNISSKTLICVWYYQLTIPSEPSKVLFCIGDVTCCQLLGGMFGIVVAGLSDGTISAWDLKEDDIWHNLPKDIDLSLGKVNVENGHGDYPILRHSSFNSCNIFVKSNTDLWAGPVVDILFFKPASQQRNESLEKQEPTNQFCSLQKYGILTIWTVMNQMNIISDALNEMNFKTTDSQYSYWSKVTLHKSLVINMARVDVDRRINLMPGTKTSESKEFLYPLFPLTYIHRRNSLKKSLCLKNENPKKKKELDISRNMFPIKIMTNINDPSLRNKIFGDVEIDNNEQDSAATSIKNSLESNSKNASSLVSEQSIWQMRLICTEVKFMQDHNNEGHFLIACNGGKVAHYLQEGYIRDPCVFFCSDNTATVNAIEVCPYELLYFLVSCDDYSIYLCSLTNGRPLKTFFNQHGITELISGQNFLERYQKEDIISVQWSKIRPCLFIALSRKGRVTVWDLMKSDLVPIIIEKINSDSDAVKEIKLASAPERKHGFENELLILMYASGKIEMHTLNEQLLYSSNISSGQERQILSKYFGLL